jgi:hypothetical protein
MDVTQPVNLSKLKVAVEIQKLKHDSIILFPTHYSFPLLRQVPPKTPLR